VPNEEVYRLKVEGLAELERLASQDLIDLYYGDESRVSVNAYVPYGWQLADEDVFMPSTQGAGLNCFALLSRGSECIFETARASITSDFIIEQFERLSLAIRTVTVVVLDNARVHQSEKVQERRRYWQERGLLLFYLLPYSPHLNLAEVLWRKLKYEWLQPDDYKTTEGLFYQVRQALSAVGTQLKIQFSQFNFSFI
jgi:transposase